MDGNYHKTMKSLDQLVSAGQAIVAWDSAGKPYFAEPGTQLPEWLSLSTSEAEQKKLPSKPKEPAPKEKEQGKKPVPEAEEKAPEAQTKDTKKPIPEAKAPDKDTEPPGKPPGKPRIETISTREGARIENHHDDSMTRVFFDGATPGEIKRQLKGRGFRWNSSIRCWEKKIGKNSAKHAGEALGKYMIDNSDASSYTKKGGIVDGKPGQETGSATGEGYQRDDLSQGRTSARTDDTGVHGGKQVEQERSGEADRQSAHLIVQTDDVESFVARIREFKKQHSYGAFVSVPEDNRGTFFVAPNGSGGFRLIDNNIESLHFDSDKGTEAGIANGGGILLVEALYNGGNRLDCFDGRLPGFYERYGFIPVARLKFNRKYAPEGWNYKRDGEPDIIFYAHNGDGIENIHFPLITPATTCRKSLMSRIMTRGLPCRCKSYLREKQKNCPTTTPKA